MGHVPLRDLALVTRSEIDYVPWHTVNASEDINRAESVSWFKMEPEKSNNYELKQA